MKKIEYFAHESSFVDSGARISRGTKIWHNSHITDTAAIGKNCNIGQNCYIAGTVGDNCRIQNNVNLYKGVSIKDFVFCGPSMTFTNDLNPRAKYPKKGNWVKTKVSTGATLGAACVIICGITIGKWAFVGAGSVVAHNVPDYALVYGNPARIHGWICECGEKMPEEFNAYKCPACKRTYSKARSKVILEKER